MQGRGEEGSVPSTPTGNLAFPGGTGQVWPLLKALAWPQVQRSQGSITEDPVTGSAHRGASHLILRMGAVSALCSPSPSLNETHYISKSAGEVT